MVLHAVHSLSCALHRYRRPGSVAQAILNAVSGDLAENQSAFTSVGSSVGPIARRTNCTMAVPWLSAICAAPNERDIASGATVEFKSTSARSHRRREKFVTNP